MTIDPFQSKISSWQLHNAHIFLRVDFNIPQWNGSYDDFRIEQTLPTITTLRSKGAKKIVLATHWGDRNQEEKQSTKQLLPMLNFHGIPCTFAETIQEVQSISDPVVLLENLRSFTGETTEEGEERILFAKELATLGDFYIDDAFGALHRAHTSIAYLPTLFSSSKKTIGLLVEKELATLSRFFSSPQPPLCVILGGGKITSKIQSIEKLVGIADYILLCPGISIHFSAAQRNNPALEESKSENEQIARHCKKILDYAQKTKTKIVLPLDYQVASGAHIKSGEADHDDRVVSIGPETVTLFSDIAQSASTILLNGLFGFLSSPETLKGFNDLIAHINSEHAICVAAGGDTVAAVRLLGKEKTFTHCSTGGGSVLAIISGQDMPGLSALV